MPVDIVADEFTLRIMDETTVARTGRLIYYDPLRMSSISGSPLATLNIVSTTLPATDPDAGTLPAGINVHEFTLTISGITITPA